MGSSVPILSERAAIILDTADVPPSNAILVTPSDTLYLGVTCSMAGLTVTLSVRVLQPDGVITLSRYDVQVSATRVAIPNFFPLSYGFILSAVVSAGAGASPGRGQVYAQLFIQRGAMSTQPNYPQQLCCGYVTYQTPIYYPFGPSGYSLEGHGVIRSITGTAPAAGTDILELVPTGATWRVQSIRYTFTTAGVAGERYTGLMVLDSTGTDILQISVDQPIDGGQTWTVNYSNVDAGSIAAISNAASTFPSNLYLPGGFGIRTATPGIMPGDVYSAPQYLVEEWLQS